MDTQLHLCYGKELVPSVGTVRNAIEGEILVKPMFGLWASTWDGEEQSSAWSTYAQAQRDWISVHDCSWWLLTPEPTARVLHITSQEDTRSIRRHYNRNRGWHRASNYIDFEAMSRDYDALHLTWDFIHAHPYSEFSRMWSVESTIWFRWCFATCEHYKPVKKQRSA